MRPLKSILLVLATLCVWQACEQTPKTNSEAEIAEASDKANQFFDRVYEQGLARSPINQGYLGIKDNNDKWDDISDEFAQEGLELNKQNLQTLLDSINPDLLDKQAKLSYDLFKSNLENQIADFKWRLYSYPVNQMFGWHTRVPSYLINIHQISDEKDARAYISRLNKVPLLFDQLIASLEQREEAGIALPKFVYPRVIDDSNNILKGAPFEKGEPGALLADFVDKVDALELDDEVKKGLKEEAIQALESSLGTAYQNLIDFLGEQEKRASTEDGAWKFPEGDQFFTNALNRTTTTTLTSDEIHKIGLSEVERIHGEMRDIMTKVNFEGELQDFFTYLKEEDQFYYPNTDEGKQQYVDSAKTLIDNMEARLDDLFITKPKARIKVQRVEKFREKSAGKAFYQSGALDGSRPGTYYANLYNTRNMPKFEMEALAYHEGIPGHHMDRSISQELTGIPKFRKFGSYTAFNEGWGLYCEFIPKEMGMYANPYSDYGRLAMELWRACRLVVDTGIHSKKWTRQDGIDYYMNNTSGTERECVRMVERHIVMPSQATAYKIGMLKILELRSKATEALGEQFDIREFHDVVLTNGPVPLSTLELLVDEYIASKQSS